MCNLSDQVIEEGAAKGLDQGLPQGGERLNNLYIRLFECKKSQKIKDFLHLYSSKKFKDLVMILRFFQSSLKGSPDTREQ